jgi:hypothetical protein
MANPSCIEASPRNVHMMCRSSVRDRIALVRELLYQSCAIYVVYSTDNRVSVSQLAVLVTSAV